MNDSYYLGVYWGARDETCQACAERIYRTLRDFTTVSPQLSRWFRLGSSRNEALQREVHLDNESIRSLLAKGRNWSDKDVRSRNGLGFSLSLWNGAAIDDQAVSISFGCGMVAKNVVNAVTLSLPTDQLEQSAMIHFKFLRSIILILVKHFSPDWGVVNSHCLYRSMLGLRENMPQVGWITYLSNHFGSIPSSIYYEQEPINRSGILIISTRERFTTTNRQHMTSVTAVAGVISRLFDERLK
jgi:Immunity protein 52